MDIDNSHAQLLLKKMSSFQKDGLFCDTALIASDGVVFAHSSVLAAICPSLCGSLNQNPFSVFQPNAIEMNQYSTGLIGLMVDFFYSGTLPENCIGDLKEACEKLGIYLETTNEVDSQSQEKNLEEMSCVDAEKIITDVSTSLLELLDDALVDSEVHPSAIQSVDEDSIEEITLEPDSILYDESKNGRQISGGNSFKIEVVAIESRNLVNYDVESHKCSMCDVSFITKRRLNVHMMTHYQMENGEFQCPTCGKAFSNTNSMRKHLLRHNSLVAKQHVCHICNRSFIRRTRLQFHLNSHNGIKPFVCDTCGQRFADSDHMTKHKRIHLDDRRYLCGFCGKRFFDDAGFRNHVRLHTGEKPFECNICSRTFAQRYAWKIHLSSHSNERSFQCEWCGKSFRMAGQLKQHVLNRHTADDAKPYQCDFCGKGFGSKCLLQSHIPRHRPLQCSRCNTEILNSAVEISGSNFCGQCTTN